MPCATTQSLISKFQRDQFCFDQSAFISKETIKGDPNIDHGVTLHICILGGRGEHKRESVVLLCTDKFNDTIAFVSSPVVCGGGKQQQQKIPTTFLKSIFNEREMLFLLFLFFPLKETIMK